MVRIWAALVGFSAGAAGGAWAAAYFNVSDTVSLIIGLAAGIILAFLAARFYLAGVFLVSWAMGIIGSVYFIKPADWKFGLLCVGIGLVIALVALKFAEPVLMIITAVLGGAAAGQAIYGIIPVKNNILQIAAIAVLIILGIITQFLMESRRRKKLHLKRLRKSAEHILQNMRWIKREQFWIVWTKKHLPIRRKMTRISRYWIWRMRTNKDSCGS
ncbi:MAG: hypothetical protein QM793_13795 [Muricomes sp.]